MKIVLQDLTSVVHALGRLEYPDRGIWLKIAGEVVKEKRLMDFDERGLSSVVYSFGKAGFDDFNSLSKIVEEIQQEPRMPRFTNQAMANMIYGLGRLEYKDGASVKRLCQEVVAPHRMKDYTEQGLSNLFFGLAKMEFKCKDTITKLMTEVVKPERTHTFRQQAMSNILFAIYKLGFDNEDLVNSFLEEFLKNSRLQKLPDSMLVIDLKWMGMITPRNNPAIEAHVDELMHLSRLKRMSVTSLSQAIHALGKMGYKDMSKAGVLVEEIMNPNRWANMTDADLGRISSGWGMLGYRDKQAWAQLSSELIHTGRLSTFGPISISSVLSGLSMMDSINLPSMVQTLEAICTEMKKPGRLEDWMSRELSNSASALGCLGFYDKELMNSICEKFIKDFDTGGTLLELNALLHACATLNHHYFPLVQQAERYSTLDVQAPEGFQRDDQYIGNTIWSLAALGVLSSPTFSNLLDSLVTLRSEGASPCTKSLLQISQGFSFVKSHWMYRPKDTSQSMLLAEARKVHRSHVLEHEVNSDFLQEVSDVLASMNIKHSSGEFLEDSYVKPDFVLGGEHNNLMVEVDGPSHYTCNEVANEYKPLGATVLRNCLLRKFGHEVRALHVQYLN